jgi:hypothetical protein
MNALRSTVKLAARSATQKVQKRQMASGAAQPKWTGIDKVIRDKFPEDYQGGYFYVGRVGCTVGLRRQWRFFQGTMGVLLELLTLVLYVGWYFVGLRILNLFS